MQCGFVVRLFLVPLCSFYTCVIDTHVTCFLYMPWYIFHSKLTETFHSSAPAQPPSVKLWNPLWSTSPAFCPPLLWCVSVKAFLSNHLLRHAHHLDIAILPVSTPTLPPPPPPQLRPLDINSTQPAAAIRLRRENSSAPAGEKKRITSHLRNGWIRG